MAQREPSKHLAPGLIVQSAFFEQFDRFLEVFYGLLLTLLGLQDQTQHVVGIHRLGVQLQRPAEIRFSRLLPAAGMVCPAPAHIRVQILWFRHFIRVIFCLGVLFLFLTPPEEVQKIHRFALR